MQAQTIPLKVYRAHERLSVAAAMPGIEPEDISIEITEDNKLIIDSALRGLTEGDREVTLDEWNPGPYHREVDLPTAVHGEMANMSYGNGVLVVVMPVTDWTRPAQLTFGEDIGHARGQRVGHTGSPPWSTTTQEHMDDMEDRRRGREPHRKQDV